MLTMNDLMPRVEKGAAWLDGCDPCWFNEIDIDVLDMAECSGCIIGQRFGAYNEIHRLTRLGEHAYAWAAEHGFAVFVGPTPEEYKRNPKDPVPQWECDADLLRECWITAILERRHKEEERLPASPETEDAVAGTVA